MKSSLNIMMLYVLIFTSACSAQKIDTKQEAKNLMELSREWAKVTQSGNAEKILSYWSEDAILMTPDQGKLVGHNQLSKMLQGAGQIPGFEVNWEPQKAMVAQSGELGYVIAHKHFKIPDDSGNLNTYYFIEVGIWEKQVDGTWKNTVDIYNPDPSITSLK